jgi:hypothetical protein
MTNRRSNLSHNGHSRTSHSKNHPRTIVAQAARAKGAISSYIPSDPVYRYGIPGAVAVGLGATGIVLRKQVLSLARTMVDSLSLEGLLGLVGLERSRSMPMKIAPAAGALALGLALGAGASLLLYVRGKERHERAVGTGNEVTADEGSMDVAP